MTFRASSPAVASEGSSCTQRAAFELIGTEGESYDDVESYVAHLRKVLPEAYLAGRDFMDYLTTLRQVESGEIDAQKASHQMPSLRRVAGTCPCSKSVRWVRDEPAASDDSKTVVHGG